MLTDDQRSYVKEVAKECTDLIGEKIKSVHPDMREEFMSELVEELGRIEDNQPSDNDIRDFLKDLESDASDSLGNLGCSMIKNALDAISNRFDISEEKMEDLLTRLAVGVVFELEPKDETE